MTSTMPSSSLVKERMPSILYTVRGYRGTGLTALGNLFVCFHYKKCSVLGGEMHSTVTPTYCAYSTVKTQRSVCVGGRRLIYASPFPVILQVTSMGLLSSLNLLQMMESFTFSFDGGNGFRIAPVSYSTTGHCSHLFKSESELV